jgi:hypothetical protein
MRHPRRGRIVRALDRFADFLVGPENPGESIYGLIVIGALLAAESGRHETYLLTIASTTIAAAIYWLAHAYSKVLGRRLIRRQRLTARTVWDALIHDWPLMVGASVPLFVLLIGALVGLPQEDAVSAAIYTVVGCLIGFELLAGLRAKAAPGELLIELSIGAAMGLAIMTLKIVLH